MNVSIGLKQAGPVRLVWCAFTMMRVLLAGLGIVLMWLGLVKAVEFSSFAEAVIAHDLLP